MSKTFYDYAVFGGVLRSRIEIPELPSAVSGPVDWSFEPGPGAPPSNNIERLGERSIGVEKYSLSRTESGFRLEYSHAGAYDISADGASIVWYAGSDPRPDLVRWCLLGSVMAVSLERAGCLCLHGSAVSLQRGGTEVAIAFLAPKHYGKSTLAAALVVAGARLIGDDTLAVSAGTPCVLRPGVPSVRLWEDAVREVRVSALGGSVVEGVKTTFTGFDPSCSASGPLPLEAVYILSPFNGDGSAAQRTRLSAGAGAIAIAQGTKLPDSLIGSQAWAAKLKTAAEIAASTPVYALRIARDFQRLPAAVGQLLQWHGEAPSVPDA